MEQRDKRVGVLSVPSIRLTVHHVADRGNHFTEAGYGQFFQATNASTGASMDAIPVGVQGCDRRMSRLPRLQRRAHRNQVDTAPSEYDFGAALGSQHAQEQVVRVDASHAVLTCFRSGVLERLLDVAPEGDM